MTKNNSPLLQNKKFQTFISAFTELSKTSENLPLADARRLNKEFFMSSETVYEPVDQVDDCLVTAKDGHQIPIRIFNPDRSHKLPVLLYFHRGGWVFGSVEEADSVCRKVANRFHVIVVSVDYRLAPENPFPIPVSDCYEAACWVAANIARFGGDASQISVSGESAGGNMAAAVALMARDRREVKLVKQVLMSPVISSTIDVSAYRDSADQYFITKNAMTFFWEMYAPSPEDKKNPYASPDKSTDFSSLPPAVIITAEYDPLHVEAESYAKKLQEAGVPVIIKQFSEVIHCFIDLPIYTEEEKTCWIKEIAGYFNQN